ncbi:MAG TPA: acetylornithine transaminase [Acidimicrobiia bacterium]|nr:acetylornithine transaminase [Acidimicrobiia bacterium]
MTNTRELIDRRLMRTYQRSEVTFVRGEGCWLYDDQGRKYLDFLAGIAVVSVGHANPRVAKAVASQMAVLTHVSNLFGSEPMAQLADRLVGLSGLDRVFFSNDGATANEAAIKLARRFGQRFGGPDRYRIVSLLDSFHGRTLATLAATGQPQKQETFFPLPPGFVQVPAGDVAALSAEVDDTTAAVLLETVQAEGGVFPLSDGYLQEVRALCDQRGALLIIDDIQAGMGRTGSWYSWQKRGIEPDVATVAKALANGLPIGVCLAREAVAEAFLPGDHGTTFGGGPVVCAAALAVIEEMEDRDLLANCRARSSQLVQGLQQIKGIKEVRGRGLLLAAVMEDKSAAAVAARALSDGLIVNAVRPDAIRMTPPLSVTAEEVDTALDLLAKSMTPVGSLHA